MGTVDQAVIASLAAADQLAKERHFGRRLSAAVSAAVTATFEGAFVRVVDADSDADAYGTLQVAAAAHQCVPTPRPAEEPVVVERADGGYWHIEVYERVIPCSRPVTAVDMGIALADLHGAPVPVDLRPQRRLAQARTRIVDGTAPADIQQFLLSEFNTLDALLADLDGKIGFMHADPHLGNLMNVGGDLLLCDWEHGGTGPIALDVAFAFGGFVRTVGHVAAAAFLDAYVHSGGPAETSQIPLLLAARELIGIASYAGEWSNPHHRAIVQERLRAFSEPFRQTRWSPVVPLGDVTPGLLV